ncbi:MSS51 protein [Sodiomyces alkalinus F11]|uniref:MSS51 protein n=1 Tax=Sodiomyces alkalinus (strain CBS 110278 / VKM F-3762 / F11) TaxID=1314773 RepID=A0A3N2Q129_SODAK|nr:MSS51 protein [Sodiomyces alkalinus F11]ROT40398.1 MSS51 protein [Sodiomyces alkalinus F11]
MEPLLRATSSGICSRCSVTLRRQLIPGRPVKRFAQTKSAHGFRTIFTTAPHQSRDSNRLARKFTTASTAQGEAAAASASRNDPGQAPRTLLKPDNLFHSFTNSPIPQIRRRAAFMRQHAYCPHPHHRTTRVPTIAPQTAAQQASEGSGEGQGGHLAPAHVDFECPDCGVPVYCSKEHWMGDYESHLEICDQLREINEDDHDLHSGRSFPEFVMADDQLPEAVVNMTNWDTFMYTREFEAVNDERSMRQVTKLLTYPITIGSILHEFSPYSVKQGGRLTSEGIRSLSALRYTLHPPRGAKGTEVEDLRLAAPPVRVFCLGARAESSLPRDVWVQLAHLFPESRIHLVFIGPESMANRDDEFPLPPRTASNPYGMIVEDRVSSRMKISTIVDYYHTIHKSGYFEPYDPYFDCFVLFHPGLGHPASSHEWEETLPQLLETKVPIIATGYTQFDMERDIEWVRKKAGGEFDILLEPGENIFRSLRWDINDLDPQDVSCGNWGVWAFRGKRYETTMRDE